MSKPVSIAARNAKVGDLLQMDLGTREWGRITAVIPEGASVRIATDNYLIGTLDVSANSRVTVTRAKVGS